MKTLFFLKDSSKNKSAINAIIRFKGQRYKLATGISVETRYWDTDQKRAKVKKEYPDAEVINIRLSRFDRKMDEFLEKCILEKIVPTLQELKTTITDDENDPVKVSVPEKKIKSQLFLEFFKSYFEENYIGQTYNKYQTTYNWLARYEKKFRKKLTFEDINLDFYTHFKKWVLSSSYKPKKDAEPVNYSLNYFGSLIKCIKKIMNVTGPHSRLKLHDNIEFKHEDFKVEHETADTIYLSLDELQKLHEFKPDVYNIAPITHDMRVENRLRKVAALNNAKNKFLIGAFTALRVSDFNRLSEVNIKENFIRIKPQKGTRKNEDVVIPIHPIIREILDNGFDIRTKISDQNINQHIKEACQLIGLDEMVSLTRTEGNSIVERTSRKYELVTSHTARRSGATNMYLAGIPSISIMKITGHKTEKSFLKYIKISQEENARLLAGHKFFQ